MRPQVTRTQLIQGWFVLITTIGAACVAADMSVTLATGAILAALSLIPPVMLRMLWPTTAPVTIAEIIYRAEQQGR